ncbi:MAG TPA: FHA domain-containing protein [Anaerolineales bacterium]|nr:FHA domain-containing protein [Anaerolineales bacterium]
MDSHKYLDETPKDLDETIFYSEKPEEIHFEEPVVPSDGIAVYYMGLNEPIAIRTEDEFIIGRQTEETNGSVLDLSGHNGFEMGVSRSHAKIRRTQTGYEVIDLSSTNGTWLKEQRLVPEKPYPLISGSMLRIARIRLLVFFLSESDDKNTQVPFSDK